MEFAHRTIRRRGKEEVDPRLAKFRESEFYTALESDELKAGFDYVFKYFIDNAVISESLTGCRSRLTGYQTSRYEKSSYGSER